MPNRTKKPFSVASVVLIALIAALLIFGLNRIPPDGLSNLLAKLIQGRDDTPLSPEQQAYETLFAEMALPETAAPRPIDSLSLTEAFAQFAFAEDYRHLYTVSYTDGERKLTRTVSLSRAGEAYELILFDGEKVNASSLLQTVRHDGETCVVEDSMGNEHLYLAGEDFPLASVAMQPDPNTFCALLEQYETDPAASPLSACTATVADSDKGRVLTLRFTDRASGREEEYHYLLDYGILYAATTRMGELVYYELQTQAFSTDTEISEESE